LIFTYVALIEREKMSKKDAQPGSCDWIPGEGREETSGGSCDWTPETPTPASGDNRSALRRFADFHWQDVAAERYKSEEGGWAALSRQVLVGNKGESVPFEVRYFEIAPGGYSSLEKHRHEHVVIVLRGAGEVLLGDALHLVSHLNVLYLAPNEPHQLINAGNEPFGFLCLVSRERDRPQPLDKEELSTLLAGALGDRLRL
jgi:quercetin dioxygenase-like cupin family protein